MSELIIIKSKKELKGRGEKIIGYYKIFINNFLCYVGSSHDCCSRINSHFLRSHHKFLKFLITHFDNHPNHYLRIEIYKCKKMEAVRGEMQSIIKESPLFNKSLTINHRLRDKK